MESSEKYYKVKTERKDRLFYLIYEANLIFLCGNESVFNSERAEHSAKQTKAKKKVAIVFATHRFIGQKKWSAMRLMFVQLPCNVSGF